jgi:DNA-binding FadR family transcriptional regulator
MKLPKITKSRLTDQVADILYRQIELGELKPGDKLPPEVELSKQLGVARQTIREALSRLLGLGLIQRGESAITVAENCSASARSMLMPMLLDQWEIHEIYEARVLIESDLAALATRKATPDDIAQLRRIDLKLAEGNLSSSRYWEHDMKFHEFLASISGNEVMIAVSTIINDLYKRFKDKIRELHGIQKITYSNHEELINAIEARDEVRAREVVFRSLRGSENALYELLQRERNGQSEGL